VKPLGAIVVAAIAATAFGIVGMNPAHASTAHSVRITLTAVGTPPACDDTTPITTTSSVIYAKPGDTISVNWTGFNITGTSGDVCGIRISSQSGVDMTGWSFFDGNVVIDLSSKAVEGFAIQTANYTFTVGTVATDFRVFNGGQGFGYGIIFTVSLSDPPVTSSESQPMVTTLTMSYGDGEACAPTSIAGVRGQWVDLPMAETCTNSSRSSSAVVLGWATQPNFPVTIAQRQVDNGWGAYETFDDDGNLTGVFIPAGGATLLSNDNVLHAIWSN